jgi:hypothetical protein
MTITDDEQNQSQRVLDLTCLAYRGMAEVEKSALEQIAHARDRFVSCMQMAEAFGWTVDQVDREDSPIGISRTHQPKT